MLYISTAPLALLSYHVDRKYGRHIPVILETKRTDLKEILLQSVEVVEDELVGFVRVVEYTDTKPPGELIQAEHNEVHVQLAQNNIAQWQGLILTKPWMKRVALKPIHYRQSLEQVQALFEPDAYRYFWEELCLKDFKSSPYKWDLEVEALSLYSQTTNRKITIDYLETEYNRVGGICLKDFVSNLGQEQSIAIVRDIPAQKLWEWFIDKGRFPSTMAYYANKGKMCGLSVLLGLLGLAVKHSLVDARSGVILVSEWMVWYNQNRDLMLSLKQGFDRTSIKHISVLLGLVP